MCLILCLAMVLGLALPAAAEETDAPALLSVEQSTGITVRHGTSLLNVQSALPQTVPATVKDTIPLATVTEQTETFDEGHENWTLYDPDSKITFSDGTMNIAATPNVKAVTGDESWTDFVVEAKLKADSDPQADYGVMIRAKDVTDEGPDSYAGFYVGMGILNYQVTPKKTGIKAGYADGKWNSAGEQEYPLTATDWNWLKLVVYRDTCTVFVKPDTADSEYAKVLSLKIPAAFDSGMVGLRSYKQGFSADTLTVRSLTEQDLADAGIARIQNIKVTVGDWTCPNYDPDTAGTYTFTSNVLDHAAYSNPDGLKAEATVTVQALPAEVTTVHSVPFSQVDVQDDFWSARQKQFICQVIPTAIDRISESGGGISNFKTAADYLNGLREQYPDGNYTTTNAPFHSGAIYVDSDDYKVIEAMSYALQLDAHGDQEIMDGQAYIRQKLNEWIPWIEDAQEDDGYLYTSYTLSGHSVDTMTRCNGRRDDMPVQPDGSPYSTVNTSDFNANFGYNHELYNFGHFYEAAVAHYRATGDFRLLNVAVKNADMVVRTFGYGDNQVIASPGHQEIELALLKLAALCQEIGTANGVDYAAKAEGYIDTAKFFLDVRGNGNPNSSFGAYSQANTPVTQQTTGYGHCVRAQYMYTGMADVALMEIAAGEENPYPNLQQIWENVTYKQQYVTGGVGLPSGEAFGGDYNLPNDGSYCETCAQISNAMWNQRMNLLYGDSEYADIIELELYSSIISCVNFDGNRFFYQNHLESNSDFGRSAWFGTACCPPNLMRTVMAIGGYIYTQDADGNITVNQYIGNNAEMNVGGKLVTTEMTTNMPWDGDSKVTVHADGTQTFTVQFRVPSWAKETSVKLNGQTVSAEANEDGYIAITRAWGKSDTVTLSFTMEAEHVTTPDVKSNDGLAAVRRGPIVY